MKKNLYLGVSAVAIALVGAGCGTMQFNTAKVPGKTYYVSVQNLPLHKADSAASPKVGSMKLGDSLTIKEVVKLQGHLATDQADPWVKASAKNATFYVPGSAIISKELWDAQLKGLPKRGEAKVKNFTSATDQEADADMMLSQVKHQYQPGELQLLLGANGKAAAASKQAYPEALGKYIVAEQGKMMSIKLPTAPGGSFGQLPSLAAFTEIGPYQEFDLGAGLAAFMMPQALVPQHALCKYVRKVVDKLLKKSQSPYFYSGYHVLVLKDDKTVNACAAPGGFVIVTTGMLKFLKNENELAMILAHEIGHLEFHHSVRSMGAENYAAFSLAALDAATDLNDPAVKKAITDQATVAIKAVPFFDKLPADTQKARIDAAVAAALKKAQDAKAEALKKMSQLAMMIGNTLTKGYDVEFEAAADRRAVSLGAAAGYDVKALNAVLARIKKTYKGFGEAYPVNRDELAAQAIAQVKTAGKPQLVGNFAKQQKATKKLRKADLFIQK